VLKRECAGAAFQGRPERSRALEQPVAAESAASDPAADRFSFSNVQFNSMIRAHDLTKSYGAFTAVDAISFEVAAGEIFAFLGPNGAGKTTTVKMLTTLLKPSSGLVEIDGLDPATQQNEVRKRFGIVFQDSSTDDELTAYENLDFHGVLYKVPKKIRSARIESLLKLFELWERRDEPVKRFSGGMRRRLEIARGFLHTPKILFLDEPTLGLDPQTRNQLWKHVQKLNHEERVTVFLTTHYMEEAERVAHRIAIIDHGRIVAQGQLAELKTLTGTDSLEKAFLALTGASIRDEESGPSVQMRNIAKMLGRR
jgi:ABC-2 type transport system ATP-binding protein